jgi:hypothetical protein
MVYHSIEAIPYSRLRTSGAAKMRCRQLALLSRTRGSYSRRIASRLTSFASLCAMGLFATLATTKTAPARSSQERKMKASDLHWNPPQVDAHMPFLPATPPCSLPDVLKQAGQRTGELVEHLRKFIAHEQIRYEQTARPDVSGVPLSGESFPIRPGQTEMSGIERFDYVVDFEEKSEPLNVHELRTRLDGTDDEQLSHFLDKGLPILALVFYPTLRSDYEMRCDGLTQWKSQPTWVVHFQQTKGRRPRTLTMETPTGLFPVGLKGRAWIAADSGQVMHIETNLVEGILIIDLREIAISVDYAPVRSQVQNLEVWLPQFVVAYTDYAKRRMIIEHTFSDFQLFSVQTQETIQKPKEP